MKEISLNSRRMMGLASIGLLLSACASEAPNAAGRPTVDVRTGQRMPEGVGHVGVSSYDYERIANEVVADLLTTPIFSGMSARPPQIIVDAAHFRNNSSQRIDMNMFTDRLRVALMRASNGRVTFVSRENSGMVEEERALRRAGRVDVGTRGMTRAQASADYRLSGRMTAHTDSDPATGMRVRLTQIQFELVDMERGTIVWTEMKDLHRAGAESVMYR